MMPCSAFMGLHVHRCMKALMQGHGACEVRCAASISSTMLPATIACVSSTVCAVQSVASAQKAAPHAPQYHHAASCWPWYPPLQVAYS